MKQGGIMQVNPPWKCDQCGDPILSIEDGWVEWLSASSTGSVEGNLHQLRLVHTQNASPRANRKNACGHDEAHWHAHKGWTVSDLPLSSFVGPDGLVQLLAWLADKRFADPDGPLEMIKRLHVPQYEEARHSFDAAIAHGALEPRSRPSYYDQQEMAAVLAWVNAQPE